MRSGNNQFTHPWTSEELEFFVSNYPSAFPDEHNLLFHGRSANALRVKATELGVRKLNRVVRNVRSYTNDADGGYVTGLVDGEGCFAITNCVTAGKFEGYGVQFAVSMRADDASVINWLKTYFDGGRTHVTHRGQGHNHPMITFCASRLYDVARCIVPHFDAYPLRAKKKRDYEVWREAVEFLCAKPAKSWNPQDLETMRVLQEKLSKVRKYPGLYG